MTMNCCKPIGGYFELELEEKTSSYHNASMTFNSGRSSLQYILEQVKPAMVHVPFYTCNGLLEPFQKTGVPYRYYSLSAQLEPVVQPELDDNELFLYINFFDLNRPVVERLSEHYGHHFIADCTLAYFAKGNDRSWFFNSCRKFFGVPDGSYLYTPKGMESETAFARNETFTVDHLLKRFNGHPEEGYPSFQQNEILCGSSVLRMSRLSEHLLSLVDHPAVAARRRANFHALHHLLCNLNRFAFSLSTGAVPMYYPFLPDHSIDKTLLYQQRLFVPTFWKDVIDRDADGFAFEKFLSANLLLLPVDHRYDDSDMQRIAGILKSLL